MREIHLQSEWRIYKNQQIKCVKTQICKKREGGYGCIESVIKIKVDLNLAEGGRPCFLMTIQISNKNNNLNRIITQL